MGIANGKRVLNGADLDRESLNIKNAMKLFTF